MKRIPLHSLILLLGPRGGGKSSMAYSRFTTHEIVSSEAVAVELTGESYRPDLHGLITRELYRRAALKVGLGERVVIDASDQRAKDRQELANMGRQAGVPVYYVICDQPLDLKLKAAGDRGLEIRDSHQNFATEIKDLMRGDGVANVIDTRDEDFEVVPKLTGGDLISQIKDRGFRGVTAVGDVHGMVEPLKGVLEWATQRGLFCVFLGDLIDYGPNPLECVNLAYDVVTRGRGVCVIGNHERKIDRWIDQTRQGQVRVRLSEGNRVTTRAIEELDPGSRQRFEIRYKTLMGFSRNHWVMGDTLFTHGAAEPEMFNMDSHRLEGEFENMALFGEVDKKNRTKSDGYPNRIYSWVDRIPAGHRVVVGHDIRSTSKPLIVNNDVGGQACFMDTGSGKGGRLTSADMLFTDQGLYIQAFKYH